MYAFFDYPHATFNLYNLLQRVNKEISIRFYSVLKSCTYSVTFIRTRSCSADLHVLLKCVID